jgi:hypothetical protein
MKLSGMNCFDIADMNRTLTTFRIKIDTMKELQIGDKIAFDERGVMIIHRASIMQPISRWLAGESRGLASETLRKYMDDLNLFLKMMLVSRVTLFTNRDYIALWSQCCCLLKNVCHGLEMLLITYKYDSVYCDKLEPYQRTYRTLLREFEGLDIDSSNKWVEV